MDDQQDVNTINIARIIMKNHHYKTIRDTEDLYYYGDGYYQIDGNNTRIKEIIQSILQDKTTNHIVIEIIAAVQRMTYVDRDEFDSDPYIINVKNGLLHISPKDSKFLTLEKHTPKYLSMIQFDVDFDLDTDTNNLIGELRRHLDYENYIKFIEMLGTLLIRDRLPQKVYFLYGPPNTLKSTMMRRVQQTIGQEFYANTKLKSLYDDWRMIISLRGKIFNYEDDIDNQQNHKYIIDILKKLIGGIGETTIDVKYKSPQKFQNRSTIIASMNTLPYIDYNDPGIHKRLIIITFDYPIERVDTSEINRVISNSEKSEFMMLAIAGYLRLHENNYRYSYEKSIDDKMNDYVLMKDPLKYFIDNYLRYNPDDEEIGVSKKVLMSRYESFCLENNLIIPKHSAFMSRRLKRVFDGIEDKKPASKTGKKRESIWVGLSLVSESLS